MPPQPAHLLLPAAPWLSHARASLLVGTRWSVRLTGERRTRSASAPGRLRVGPACRELLPSPDPSRRAVARKGDPTAEVLGRVDPIAANPAASGDFSPA
jgi:hypothetical protein